jgi:hypothetical protein
VQPAARETGHFRHEHKYSLAGTDGERAFHFRDRTDRLTGAVARNLNELEAELAGCSDAILRHHCPRHDLSRWVSEVFHDRTLAATLAGIEARVGPESSAVTVGSARLDLVGGLQERTHRRPPA